MKLQVGSVISVMNVKLYMIHSLQTSQCFSNFNVYTSELMGCIFEFNIIRVGPRTWCS